MGPTSTKLGVMFLLKDTTQRQWGSNLWPLGLESSTLPLSHCTPIFFLFFFFFFFWGGGCFSIIPHIQKYESGSKV